MSEGKKRVPRLRFPGFEGEWEERKLGEIINVNSGCDYKHLSEGNIPVYGTGGYMLSVDKALSYSEDAIGIGRKGTIDKPYILKAPFWTVDTLFYVIPKTIPKTKEHLYFLLCLFLKINWKKRDESTGVPSLSKQTINSEKVFLPKKNEQIEIGSFFKQIDNLIHFHQQKIEHLKKVKTGLLQKMFPKEGAKVPEIRFPEFTGEWERHKLKELTKFRRGSFPQPYGKKEWYDGEGAMPFVQVVDVTDHLVLTENTKQKISKLAQPMSVFVPKGTIIVTLQGSIGRVALTQYDAFCDRTLLIFESFSDEQTDPYYWGLVIQKKFEIEKKKAPGGTIKTITKEALSEFDILLPTNKEQEKIGAFFKQFDRFVTFHQRKLEHLQQLKKGLLQQMFV